MGSESVSPGSQHLYIAAVLASNAEALRRLLLGPHSPRDVSGARVLRGLTWTLGMTGIRLLQPPLPPHQLQALHGVMGDAKTGSQLRRLLSHLGASPVTEDILDHWCWREYMRTVGNDRQQPQQPQQQQHQRQLAQQQRQQQQQPAQQQRQPPPAQQQRQPPPPQQQPQPPPLQQQRQPPQPRPPPQQRQPQQQRTPPQQGQQPQQVNGGGGGRVQPQRQPQHQHAPRLLQQRQRQRPRSDEVPLATAFAGLAVAAPHAQPPPRQVGPDFCSQPMPQYDSY